MIRSLSTRFRDLFVLALLCFLLVAPARAQQTQRIYFVGNSVTDAMNYQGLQALAQTRGNGDTWSRLMIPGAPLSYLWDNFRATGSGGFIEQPYGNPENAFAVYTWDILSLQPFDRQIEGADGDRVMVGNFYNLIKPKSPDCKVFIYAHWPRTPGGISQLDATRAQYNAIWTSPTDHEARKFYQDLTTVVRSDYPATSANILMVPIGEVFYSLNNNQAFLDAAGMTSIWGVYSDGIHLKGIGSYITACVVYAMAYHDDPSGLSVPGAYGAIPAACLPYIHQTIKDVIIAKSAFTGISYFGPAPVQSIKLNAAAMELNVTKTATLVPAFTPTNAANKTVTWTSSNGSIASVVNGLVTANAVGSANITVTSADGGFQSVCAVTVVNMGTAVTGISLNKSSTSILVGATETLVATVAPAGATNKSVAWTSSDAGIATVSATGLVTAVKKGVATITATTVNGLFAATTMVNATRLNNPPVAVMKYSPGNFGYAPYKVSFDGRSSSDPDPDDFVLGYDWIIKEQGASSNLKTEISNTFDYTFASAGVYDVTLQAVDNAENLRSLNTVQTTITVLAMPAVPAAETALCYEGFDYVKAPITNFNGGRGWRQGWEVQDPPSTTVDEFAVNNVSPMLVPGLRQVGNYMILGQGSSQCGRMLDITDTGAFKDYLGPSTNGTMIGKSGTTLWFSCIIRPQSNNKVCGVSFVDTGIGWYGANSGKKVEFGGFGGSYWGFAFGFESTQVQHLSNVPIVNDVPVFLVAKVDFGATNTVSLYVNPNPGSTPVGTPVVGSTTTPLSFRTLGTTFGTDKNKMGLDEIRFGASYADVAPLSDSSAVGTAAPTFSPGAGNYTSTQAVTLTSATPGAAIRYTTDGSNPTSTVGTLYIGTVTVSATTTVKAIAYADSLDDSSVSTATYTINTALPVTARGENLPNEGLNKLTDGNIRTKWLDFSATSWVNFSYVVPTVWNTYAITSGDDAPERDPKNWTISGSNDGTTWTVLDTRTNQTWAARGQTNRYTFSNIAAYSSYKWDITANGSGSIIQAAEFTFSTQLAAFRTATGLAANGSQDLLTPAGDGVENLLKYAFNMIGPGAGQAATLATPNSAVLTASGNAGLPFTSADGSGKLVLTFIRRKAAVSPPPGISYAVQFSNDLGVSDPWSVNGSATEIATSIDSAFERVTVTDSFVSPDKRFARVRISVP